jgi:hypothetical protein
LGCREGHTFAEEKAWNGCCKCEGIVRGKVQDQNKLPDCRKRAADKLFGKYDDSFDWLYRFKAEV